MLCLVWSVLYGMFGMGFMIWGIWYVVLALGVWYGLWGIIHDVVGMVCLV